MEKVITVGIKQPNTSHKEIHSLLDELAKLLNTAGGEVLFSVIQNREKFDPAYLIGKGKAEDIHKQTKIHNIKTVVFNEPLTPAQQRNLENIIDAKIIDRTRLILDIFAQRAKTREAELQVELAQMNYFLPRLTQHGIWLDGQVGGIGTKGPGERKLEYDRRHIRAKILHLKQQIDNIRKYREIQRTQRTAQHLPVVALVGYTNVGKSTLLNRIVASLTNTTENVVYSDNKLFATLDPITRRVKLPAGKTVLFSDTVGFIRKLPHQLIASFRATLEEILQANCIVHLVDLSNNDYRIQEKTVLETISELGAVEIPIIKVYNKVDLLSSQFIKKIENNDNNALFISAKSGFGLENLFNKIYRILTLNNLTKTISIPYNKQHCENLIYSVSKVISKSYTKNYIKLKIQTDPANLNKIQKQIKK